MNSIISKRCISLSILITDTTDTSRLLRTSCAIELCRSISGNGVDVRLIDNRLLRRIVTSTCCWYRRHTHRFFIIKHRHAELNTHLMASTNHTCYDQNILIQRKTPTPIYLIVFRFASTCSLPLFDRYCVENLLLRTKFRSNRVAPKTMISISKSGTSSRKNQTNRNTNTEWHSEIRSH